MNRRGYLDWLRGIAVLIMIEAHTFDSWTRVADRAHPIYGPLMVLAGFGAPIFLFLAGIALALAAGSRQRKGKSDGEVAALARRRAWQIFGLALLFRLQSVLISGGRWSSLLKVDILNVMGVSMLLGALFWGWGRSRRSRFAWLMAATIAFAMLTPIIRQMEIFAPLPDRLEGYFRPAGNLNTFSLFPWTGFLFAGAAIGLWLDAVRAEQDERRTVLTIGGLGLALAIGGYAASYLPPLYEVTNFWTSSPTFFFLRVGVLMMAVPIAFAWNAAWSGYSPVQDFGRSSLFIYWIHVEMVYGVVSAPLHRQLSFRQAVLAYAVFTILLYLVAKAKDRLIPGRPSLSHWPIYGWRRSSP